MISRQVRRRNEILMFKAMRSQAKLYRRDKSAAEKLTKINQQREAKGLSLMTALPTQSAGRNKKSTVPWGARRLDVFKEVNGKFYQLHATRGWKMA